MTDKVLAIIPAAGIGERFQSDIPKQYENGSYTEVWFRDSTVGLATPPQEKF